MPIEIRELIITATVNDGNSGPTPEGQGPETRKKTEGDKQAIIQECVEQVMEILNKKQRR
jgi:hypothetical protein